MITIKTNYPDNIIKYYSEYFLMHDNYLFAVNVEEFDDEFVVENFGYDTSGNLLYPVLVLTNNDDVIMHIDEKYISQFYTEGEDLLPTFVDMIDYGFLPIAKEPINEFISCYHFENRSNEVKILSVFEAMRYVKFENGYVMPTMKLIETINDIETQLAFALKAFVNDVDICKLEDESAKKIEQVVFECLKLVDIRVFELINGCENDSDGGENDSDDDITP